MNKVPGGYWKPKPELLVYLQKEPLHLNPHPIPTPMEHLQTLYSDTVRVTKQFSKDGMASPSYITIVAAPLLATLGEFSASAGIMIANY
jgi:hypothetical protein